MPPCCLLLTTETRVIFFFNKQIVYLNTFISIFENGVPAPLDPNVNKLAGVPGDIPNGETGENSPFAPLSMDHGDAGGFSALLG